jgi:LemA protein
MEEQNFWQKNMKWLVVLGIIVIIAFWAVSKYNFFINTGEQATAQWAQVENQYQRRFDLIPNIVNTVKGFAAHEQAIYDSITAARAQYSGATTPDQKAQAATAVEGALGRLLVIAESNPAIQSAPAFQSLMVTLEGTENRITVERQKYNDLVRVFDTNVKTFPTSILAKMFGVTERAYFDVPTVNQVAPKVDFTQ